MNEYRMGNVTISVDTDVMRMDTFDGSTPLYAQGPQRYRLEIDNIPREVLYRVALMLRPMFPALQEMPIPEDVRRDAAEPSPTRETARRLNELGAEIDAIDAEITTLTELRTKVRKELRKYVETGGGAAKNDVFEFMDTRFGRRMRVNEMDIRHCTEIMEWLNDVVNGEAFVPENGPRGADARRAAILEAMEQARKMNFAVPAALIDAGRRAGILPDPESVAEPSDPNFAREIDFD